MDKRLTTAAIALALGLVWTAAPAMAQQSTTEKVKDKAESAKDKVEDKTREVKDKVMEKATGKTSAERAAEKAEKKAEKAADKAEGKADSAMDRAKDKAAEMKDKVKDKMHRGDAKAGKADVVSMQQALKDKGFDPGPADGVMGPRTRGALRDFQKKEGLNPTGRWDHETGAKLGVQMSATTPADTMTRTSPSASPASPSMPSTTATPPGVSTQPPAVPEDKTAPPSKRTAP
jgi:peptidoglycan hydrolase-like protein with peptidoglycan-binding domain